jgi:hypothetical protein
VKYSKIAHGDFLYIEEAFDRTFETVTKAAKIFLK